MRQAPAWRGLRLLLLGAACAMAPGSIVAASLGVPALESGLGEPLRMVLPVLASPRENLTPDCVKLRGSNVEANDISDRVRADVVTIGESQSVVLTTARPVNDLVISVAVAIECGTWFTRRYTLLLDLPSVERESSRPSIVAATVAAIVPPAAPTAAPAAPKAIPMTRERNRMVQRPLPAMARSGAIRPEDEPGVLPRASRPSGKKPPAPLAPPVRSMLTIQLGGLDEFLASQPRSPIEQQTGMRLATGLSEKEKSSPSIVAKDLGFSLAHARYLAAMRDAPDPLSTENAALGRRIDAFSKDLASLKGDLQKTRARAEELEASRVAWWWLLIVGVATAGLALGLAMMFFRRSASGEPLIVVDRTPERTAPARPASPGRIHDPSSAETHSANAANIEAAEGAVEPAFSIPELAGGVVPVATSAPLPAAAIVTQMSAPAPVKPDFQAPRKLDKNSLTQQLSVMTDLSDEAWASYRHSSDTSGVAVPFGTGPKPVTTVTTLDAAVAKPARPELPAMDFQLDLDDKPGVAAGTNSETPHPAGSDAAETVAADAIADAASAADAHLHESTGAPFLLETLDMPAGLANPPEMEAPLAVEKWAPGAMQSVEMHVVMASASSMMESVHKQLEQGQPSAALRALGSYLQSAPATAPPGPWIMLAHVFHQVGMRREYGESQALFKSRFGVDLPNWEEAYELKRQQLGLARVPGIEIMVAAERGKPELIERLAGVAYRVNVTPEVLFDLSFHREILQLAANCRPGFSSGGNDVDLAL